MFCSEARRCISLSSRPVSTSLANETSMCIPKSPLMTFWFIFSTLPSCLNAKLVNAATTPSLSGPTAVIPTTVLFGLRLIMDGYGVRVGHINS